MWTVLDQPAVPVNHCHAAPRTTQVDSLCLNFSVLLKIRALPPEVLASVDFERWIEQTKLWMLNWKHFMSLNAVLSWDDLCCSWILFVCECECVWKGLVCLCWNIACGFLLWTDINQNYIRKKLILNFDNWFIDVKVFRVKLTWSFHSVVTQLKRCYRHEWHLLCISL